MAGQVEITNFDRMLEELQRQIIEQDQSRILVRSSRTTHTRGVKGNPYVGLAGGMNDVHRTQN